MVRKMFEFLRSENPQQRAGSLNVGKRLKFLL
jgi:hypothetical protein